MRDWLDVYDRWRGEGKRVAVATVVAVRGSAPRPEGSRFLVSSTTDLWGSVSGGCVENDVAVHAQQVLDEDLPRLVTYGISDEEAFEVGLACGGTIEVFIEPMGDPTLPAIRRLVADERLGALAVVVAGPATGERAVLDAGGAVLAGRLPDEIAADVADDAIALMATEQHRTLAYGDHRVFLDTIAPRPRLVVVGAVAVTEPLVAMAHLMGFDVTVADPRPAFTKPERFPDADAVLVGWPADLNLEFDARSYLVVLSHDARIEDAVLPVALRSDARYVGALGSRRTHAKRLERLRAMGFEDGDLARINGPVGLDLGAETPAEVAVSILAEMTLARYGAGSALPLTGTTGRIHSGG